METNDVNSPNPGTLHFTLPERRNIFWQECRRYLLVVEVRDRSAEAFRATVHRRKRRCYADRASALRLENKRRKFAASRQIAFCTSRTAEHFLAGVPALRTGLEWRWWLDFWFGRFGNGSFFRHECRGHELVWGVGSGCIFGLGDLEMERGRTASRCATTAARKAYFRVEKEFGCSASAGRRYAKQAKCKNVENPGVKSTPGAPTSLRSARPSSIEIQERIYLLGVEVGDRSA